jgi:hypothetical protein
MIEVITDVLSKLVFFSGMSLLAVLVPSLFVVPLYLMGVSEMLKDGLIRQDVVDEHVGDWKSMVVSLLIFSIIGGVVVTLLIYLRPLLN